MIGISGIRGIYGEGLNDNLARRFARAFGKLSGRPVVVGRDSRMSGLALSQSVVSGLVNAGVDVIDLGIASTPTTEMAVMSWKAAGGIIITASHNPREWNGLKFIGPDGVFISAGRGEELVRLYESTAEDESVASPGIHTSWDGADNRHIAAVLDLDLIDVERIRSNRFIVCIDAVNGAGGSICTELLQQLGCIIHGIHTEPTGDFPRGAEPVPENLGDLCDCVKKKGANVGFAVDPDVDRLSIVNELGEAIGEEYTLALAADFIMEKAGGPAACNLSTSRMIDDAAERHGTVVYRSPVGEINVVEAMREHKATVGGEGNGGVILPSLHYGRDAVLGIALILQIMAERVKPISELAGEFPHYTMVKDKTDIAAGKGAWIEPVKRLFDGERMDFRDGIKILLPLSWVHIRESNTEPIVRIMAEAPSEKEAKELVRRVLGVVNFNGYKKRTTWEKILDNVNKKH